MYIMGDVRRLNRIVGRCHLSDREDAKQEAELARLLGKKPSAAANNWRWNQGKFRDMHKSFVIGEHGEYLKPGKRGELMPV